MRHDKTWVERVARVDVVATLFWAASRGSRAGPPLSLPQLPPSGCHTFLKHLATFDINITARCLDPCPSVRRCLFRWLPLGSSLSSLPTRTTPPPRLLVNRLAIRPLVAQRPPSVTLRFPGLCR